MNRFIIEEKRDGTYQVSSLGVSVKKEIAASLEAALSCVRIMGAAIATMTAENAAKIAERKAAMEAKRTKP